MKKVIDKDLEIGVKITPRKYGTTSTIEIYPIFAPKKQKKPLKN